MNTRSIRLTAFSVCALCLVSGSALAQLDGAAVSFTTGIEYSNGQYGGFGDIEELYVPFTARIGFDRIGLGLTLPYLRVNAPAETIAIDPDAATVTESGLGDVIGSITLYDLYASNSENFFVDVTGKIKFGTADVEKGLGTGENDYTLQFDAYRYFDNFTLQGSAGYRLRGEPPGVELQDVFLASVGGTYLTPTGTMLGLYYDYRQASLGDSDDIQELSAFLSLRLNKAWQLQFYVLTGVGDSSLDLGGGVMISTDLRQLRISERQNY
jgi:hypothetical protein